MFSIINILGYIGMILTIIGLSCKKVKWLRIFNGFGNIFNTSYGILTQTWPTALLNGILVIINLTMLIIILIEEHKHKINCNIY